MRSRAMPSYQRQRGRSKDRAFVRLNGRRHYLGEYGSPESKEAYRRLIVEWAIDAGAGLSTSSDLTVVELIAHFWKHAQSYYRRLDGTPTTEIGNFRLALRPLKELYGRTPADAFGPKSLKVVRQHMIDLGWARTNINAMVSRIRHVFRWAAENELVPPEIYYGLRAVPGLKRGRTRARETEPVRPVPEAHIEAIQPYVSRQIWALIQLQLLTAARSGEIVGLRPVDLNMRGKIWTYEPAHHKTAHHGHKAQQVIKPFLADRPVDACLFSAAEAEATRRTEAHRRRKSHPSSGHSPGTNRKRHPKQTPRICRVEVVS